MFVGAAEFDQCLLDTSFPGDALDTNMFGETAGASYNPVSDLSDERCPATAPPSTTPHAPVYSTRQRLHVFDHLSEAELEQLNEDMFTAIAASATTAPVILTRQCTRVGTVTGPRRPSRSPHHRSRVATREATR